MKKIAIFAAVFVFHEDQHVVARLLHDAGS